MAGWVRHTERSAISTKNCTRLLETLFLQAQIIAMAVGTTADESGISMKHGMLAIMRWMLTFAFSGRIMRRLQKRKRRSGALRLIVGGRISGGQNKSKRLSMYLLIRTVDIGVDELMYIWSSP